MARHAVVPFLGREAPLAELHAWAAEAAALSIAVLTGRGGTGKTRLAAELCAELGSAGWDAGFLPRDTLAAILSAPPPSDLRTPPSGQVLRLEASRPTLVVLDGPEPSAPLVGELIRRLAQHGRNPRIRLLLVAREPGDPDWWRRLDTAAGGRLRRLNTTRIQLNTHPLTLPEREDHALAAMRAFAPGQAALPTPPRLDDPEYGLPLHVHLAALLHLDGDSPVSGATLIDRFLTRESARWSQLWQPRPEDDQPTAPQPQLDEHGDAIAPPWERFEWFGDLGDQRPGGPERLGHSARRQAVAVLLLTTPPPRRTPRPADHRPQHPRPHPLHSLSTPQRRRRHDKP
ncbi:hypothetical protein [Nonomuraea salmonea]|uniref:hypothetical protein n=1 Tax=Nonomuraea salmonea TaxID=46181 RepID=UPI002FEC8B07